MNTLQKLYTLGQSPWYDNISRDLLHSGEIQRLVDLGIRGLTSNPSIFKKAITTGSAYDSQIAQMAAAGHSPQAIYEGLAIYDIQHAADILRPVYDASEGVDGFVSLEVSPLLASDTPSTLGEARRLAAAVDRPNLFIKIPATPEGLPAIEQGLADGININVTLIFSRAMYDRVMEAYLRALERRLEAGQPIDRLRSVASFFVSRVDTLVDDQLAAQIAAGSPDAQHLANLQGKAAIANAQLAYQDYRRRFESDRFRSLASHGARVQRPLWASTSTKNPAYPDTIYVDTLIGPDTVNTMPAETVEAFLDHGTPALTLETDLAGAEATLAALEAAGISMADATQRLLDDGVEKFAQPFTALLEAIEAKAAAFKAGVR